MRSDGAHGHSNVRLFVHLVWGTKGRQPLLNHELGQQVYAAMAKIARDLSYEPIAIGGTADHVHVLVRSPACCNLPQLLNAIKGSSSHLVNHVLRPGGVFAWQPGYAARSVDPAGVPRVAAYIHGQEEHHRVGTQRSAWEVDWADE